MINIVKGNVLEPQGEGIKLIVHVCNDIGVMGAGVAKAIADKWPKVKYDYQSWHNRALNRDTPFVLGQIQICKAEEDIYVCNMIGQRDVGGFIIDGEFIPPVRYEAIKECLLRVRERVRNKVSVHMPLIGCGLAGGSINNIYYIIDDVFEGTDISVTIYCLSDDDVKKVNKAKEDVFRLNHGLFF